MSSRFFVPLIAVLALALSQCGNDTATEAQTPAAASAGSTGFGGSLVAAGGAAGADASTTPEGGGAAGVAGGAGTADSGARADAAQEPFDAADEPEIDVAADRDTDAADEDAVGAADAVETVRCPLTEPMAQTPCPLPQDGTLSCTYRSGKAVCTCNRFTAIWDCLYMLCASVGSEC